MFFQDNDYVDFNSVLVYIAFSYLSIACTMKEKQATKFTWFNKRVDDQHFLNAVQSGQVNKYIQEFIKRVQQTVI